MPIFSFSREKENFRIDSHLSKISSGEKRELEKGRYLPIIIIGAARSGTKFIRDILGASPEVATVPYDVNYVWRYGNSRQLDDEISADAATPKIAGFVRSNLESLARFNPDSHGAVVEKTVSNGLRIPFIEKIFPDARYVVLVRDGRAVTESAMRMWTADPQLTKLTEKLKSLPLRNFDYVLWFALNYVRGKLSNRGGGAVWGPRYAGILDDVAAKSLTYVCARQWSKTVDAADTALAAIPADRVFRLRYEELVTDEMRLVELLSWLGFKESASVLNAYHANVVRGLDRKWETALSDPEKKEMLAAAGDTLARLGYVD